MRTIRLGVAFVLAALVAAAALALLQAPAIAAGHDGCPTRPLPPPVQDACRACPTFVDPVVCTVVCAGGPREKRFTNQCFANCSGLIILGECRRTGF